MKKKFSIELTPSLCKCCGICVEFCVPKVFSVEPDGQVKVTDCDSCNGCLLCELRCPDYAIEVVEKTI